MAMPLTDHPRTVHPMGPISSELVEVALLWARSQHRMVLLAAAFADSREWIVAGSPSAAHWLAAIADVEACTAREWVRIGRKLRELPATADAFAEGRLSYSKVRTLTRIATVDNEAELVAIAVGVPAGDLGRALAAWLTRNSDPDELDQHHQRHRSVRWRTEPDGMVTFTLRLPPLVAGALIAWLTMWVMTSRRATTHRGVGASGGAPGGVAGGPSVGAPTVAQQHADAIEALVTGDSAFEVMERHRRGGTIVTRDAGEEAIRVRRIETEVVIHVRGDGCAFDDGTPVSESVVERIVPAAFLRALIHDAEGRPVNASGRQRHPSARQRRVVKERDRVCRDCGRADLLEFDHVPAYETTGHTLVDELQLRCAPCHDRRHAA